MAALRLAEIQQKQGHEVEIISAKGNILTLSDYKRTSLSLSSKAVTLFNRTITASPFDSLTPVSLNALSKKEILSRNPSVVHLHNAYNLIDFPNFLELGNLVPIIATLHDERWLTGGCHLTLGCTKYREACTECPQARSMKNLISRSQHVKVNALQKRKTPLEVISPSRWLQHQVSSAEWTNQLININVIPNVIPNVNQSQQPSKSNERFQVLIVAASPSVNKGVTEAIQAMIEVAQIKCNRSFELRIIGGRASEKRQPLPNLVILEDGSVDATAMGALMSQANLLLVASKSENSPNVISESQLHKLAVLATNVGGIPELIDEMKTGFLCLTTKSDIAKRIVEISELPTEVMERISLSAYKAALERHDPDRIQVETLRVYLRAGASE